MHGVNLATRSLENALATRPMSHPTAIRVSNETEKRVGKAAGAFLQMVECFTIEAGISDLLECQLHRLCHAIIAKSGSLLPPFFWMYWLPSGPLRPRATCRSSMSKDPSFAWVYAVSVFQPEFLMAETGLSRQEIQDFSIWIGSEFFQKTADLLKKAKNVDSVTDYWATLNEHLTTICLLAAHVTNRRWLEDRFAVAFASLTSHPKIPAGVKSLEESCEGVESHPKAVFATNEEIAGTFNSAFETLYSVNCAYQDCIDAIKGHSFANEGGLVHLQRFTQHWLEKLGEGPVPYDQMLVKILQLDTLGRIDFSDGFEERREFPPEFYQERVQRIVNAVSTRLGCLTPLTSDELFLNFLREILAATEPHYGQFNCRCCRDRWTSAWMIRALYEFEISIAYLRGKSSPRKGRTP